MFRYTQGYNLILSHSIKLRYKKEYETWFHHRRLTCSQFQMPEEQGSKLHHFLRSLLRDNDLGDLLDYYWSHYAHCQSQSQLLRCVYYPFFSSDFSSEGEPLVNWQLGSHLCRKVMAAQRELNIIICTCQLLIWYALLFLRNWLELNNCNTLYVYDINYNM